MAKVRPGIAAMAVLAVALLMAPAAEAKQQPQVTIAVVPDRVSVGQLARIDGIGVAILSAGIGEVPADQTYLDVGQGARVPQQLYDRSLPPLKIQPAGGGRLQVAGNAWREVRARADSAPADLVPGLLASTLAEARATVFSQGALLRRPGATRRGGLMLIDKGGVVPFTTCRGCPSVVLGRADLGDVRALVSGLRGNDLVIAIEQPPPAANHGLALGIAGRGFDGTLTSDSTRMRGYVLSSDLAPTILDRLGIDIPDEMTGEPIRAEGAVDAAYVTDLEDRLAAIGPRRAPVVGLSVLGWVVLTALAAAAYRRAGARVGLTMLAVTLALVPAALLACAAIEPSELAEGLIVGIGCPALAALVLLAAPGMRGLAVAAAVSVIAYAIDVVAGFGLTELSLIGPNPIGGVRFYGIGNELEATAAALVPIGTGAALAGWAPRGTGRAAAVAFALTGLVAVAAFAPGRFGADVGAAIAIPVGVAVAIAVCLEARRGRLAWVIAAPLATLAVLVLVDLALGGGAHLTRTVLRAGGLESLGETFQRRLELSAHSFGRYAGTVIFWIVVALIVVGAVRWRTIRGWFGARRDAWAGFVGAAAATVVGTLANDSGALLLMIGAVLLAAAAGLAWATRPERHVPTFLSPSGPVT